MREKISLTHTSRWPLALSAEHEAAVGMAIYRQLEEVRGITQRISSFLRHAEGRWHEKGNIFSERYMHGNESMEIQHVGSRALNQSQQSEVQSREGTKCTIITII